MERKSHKPKKSHPWRAWNPGAMKRTILPPPRDASGSRRANRA